jgi:hypothetical protein
MKASSILAAGFFAIATVSAATASAKIVNESYYPPGEDFVAQQSVASRAEVKAETRQANLQIQARQPRREFGAGSHDNSPEVMSRDAVKANTRDFVRVGAHVPFSY